MQSELNSRLPCPRKTYRQRKSQIVHVCLRSTITSHIRGNLDRSFPTRGSWTKMLICFKAGNPLRFAEALVAISIYAYAFSADAQVAPNSASTSTSASATPTLNLRVPVMRGGTPPSASYAPPVGPFEQEVTSLENRRPEFHSRRLSFTGVCYLWATEKHSPGALRRKQLYRYLTLKNSCERKNLEDRSNVEQFRL